MNKRLVIIGLLILVTALVGKLLFVFGKNIKLDDFHKSAVIFVIKPSENLQEVKYIKSLCAVLDPEDEVKIIKSSSSSYLIYEGSAADSSNISKVFEEFSKDTEASSYGEGIKKALDHALTMKKEGYVPSVVVVGDLVNEGDISKQINWQTLPKNIEKVKQYIPELAMMFIYASPEKLDIVKTKLNPVLGETKLIIANKVGADKANRRFLKAIGR
ncbi:hypothetical protein IJ579_01770 [bacterium]|nr:hypothetical protein [bacterium]